MLFRSEKKAAALPPALTVPMILFFLPVLFIAILTPAFIQMSENGAMESTKAGGAKKAAEENR